jgi:hypothetical protein
LLAAGITLVERRSRRIPKYLGTGRLDARRQTSGDMDVFDVSSRAQSTWIRLRSRAGTETEANAEVPELRTAVAARCWHLRYAPKTKPEPGGSASPATSLGYEQTYPWALNLIQRQFLELRRLSICYWRAPRTLSAPIATGFSCKPHVAFRTFVGI